jgi:5-methylcytosine-specific restriction protein A
MRGAANPLLHSSPCRDSAMVERLRGRAGQAQRICRLRRTTGLCEDCANEGRVEVANVVDHIIPLAKGGSDEDENTRNLCHYHHCIRTAEQFGFKPRPTIGKDGWQQ